MREVRLSSIDLNLLLVFEAIMVGRSVSSAAERLNRTQSAVSHALGRLRDLIDDPLFIRTPRGMVPTAHAESIAPRIHAALVEIQQALSPQIPFDPAHAECAITIGMTDYMAYLLMPDLTARLRESAPGITLTVLPCYAKACQGPLENERIALFVGNPPPELPAYLATMPLFHETQVCVARADHPALAQPPNAEQYLGHAHVNVSPWGETGYVDAMLAQFGVQRTLAITVGSFLAVPPILERSDLLATLPARLATRLARHYPLAIRSLPFTLPVSEMMMTWHRRLDRDARLAWLRSEIAAIFLPDAANSQSATRRTP